MFLARYLDNNYLLDNLYRDMIHLDLYDAMERQWGITKAAVTLENMSADRGYAINGKMDIYEQILLEIIKRYMKSDLFETDVTQNQQKNENKIHDMLKSSEDIIGVLKEYPDLLKDFLDEGKSTWKCCSNCQLMI